MQDRLGHTAFGLVAACSALAIVVATVADLGLTQFTVQRLAAEPGFADSQFPTLLPMRGLLTLLALLALLAVGWGLGYRGSQLYLLAAVGAGLLLTQYGQFLRAPVQARQHFNTDAVLSVLEKLLALGLVVGLLLGGQLGLGSYVGARLAAAAFTAVLFMGLLRRLFGRLPHRWPRWRPAGQLLRGSMPFAFIALLYGVNERVDMVLLERLSSAREAGYYAGAYRWLDAIMMYAWTVLPLFFARFAHAAARPRELRQLLWLGQRVVAIPLLLLVAFVLFRGEVLFWQFGHSTGPELARMVLCLKILFLNVLVHAFFAIYSTLLTSTRHQQAVSWLVALSIGLNLTLNLLLLPRYGAIAAAINTLLSVLLVSGGYVWLVSQRMRVRVPWHLMAQLALAFGLLCGSWYLVRTQLTLVWWLETGLMGVFFAGLLPLTGLVKLRELHQLLKLVQSKRG
ncbi:oligosaccharide flippase family protein [Hymenobacter baengnokdamensis]|uniref:oligosaccharide flippase family protein n=1 Tax=Hymenobacter baengnokdamensis TaxID=2615203 RepID=UPI00124473CC|nr:oligosaccharide flippase family protein [Hymenobacter baengnokdamensis]